MMIEPLKPHSPTEKLLDSLLIAMGMIFGIVFAFFVLIVWAALM
jgi:LPS O-antigen subunit length determinant protein (WzzB/FepE family)